MFWENAQSRSEAEKVCVGEGGTGAPNSIVPLEVDVPNVGLCRTILREIKSLA